MRVHTTQSLDVGMTISLPASARWRTNDGQTENAACHELRIALLRLVGIIHNQDAVLVLPAFTPSALGDALPRPPGVAIAEKLQRRG